MDPILTTRLSIKRHHIFRALPGNNDGFLLHALPPRIIVFVQPSNIIEVQPDHVGEKN
ncbi:hypothetical protein GOC91_20885 [Sinorhizobium medicae]|uniref:Uncharacterized protein n=2 Tax=Sinorhizobium medicae TaxID=110321 RepID=A6U7S3_SINMW|nr:hypothetical protein Smed_0848 [Sinorhizobium medicae WSM419]MDX0407414.1 hypothetical protein [Sinorhizobium medicae]MDX0413533.1 hypothetical protein [Sinorhizobium medicae]MDX0419344.1 hypothetical protein [Sinorhizobium medicae]MDX0424729.1 hypothetical protein [Sinorhizobium medicae]